HYFLHTFLFTKAFPLGTKKVRKLFRSPFLKKRVYLLQFSLLAGLIGFYFGCNKTDHPFGVDAPYGLDVPTLTPTPGTGAIEVYVSDTGAAIQSVNIYLLDPA